MSNCGTSQTTIASTTRLYKVTYDRSREILARCLKAMPIETRRARLLRIETRIPVASHPRTAGAGSITLRTVAAGSCVDQMR